MKKTKTTAHYKRVCDRLTSQLESLALLAAEQQQLHDAEACTQLLLAEVILNNRVLYQLVQPQQGRWIKQQCASCSQPLVPQQWAPQVELAAATNPLLRTLLTCTPGQVCALAGVTAEAARQALTAGVQKVLLLQELLSPNRFPQSLVITRAHNDNSYSQQAAACAQANGHEQEGLAQPDIVQASKQLLARLQEYQATLAAADMLVSVLTLHQPVVLFEVNTVNMETGEPCTPPMDHFMHAAQRLRLTTPQLQQLRLLLKQYNRLSRQQHADGQQLLNLSEQSFSLQASLSCTAGSPAQRSSSQASDSSVASAKAGQRGAGGQQDSGDGSTGTSGKQAHAQQEADQPEDVDTPLDKLLQRHLCSRRDMFRMVALSAVCFLTPWQMGQWMVACFPFKVNMLALVELSPSLTPDDTPQAFINASACPEAAQAAALAEELGYCGADGFMQRRRAALERQLQWVLQQDAAC